MKKLPILFLLLILLFSLVFVWFYTNSKPVSNNKDFKNFLIEKGSSASEIGAKLESSGFIKNALAFKLYVQATGTSGNILAGEYRLTPSFSLFQVVGQLTRGPVEIWVTIPEGFRREEVAAKFTASLDRDNIFFNEFIEASKGLEGTLFPDTYLFAKEASASTIVNKMTRTFDAKTNSFNAGPEATFDQRVILASLIERETKTAEERPIVAGILLKRLKAGWPLQIDASVEYAVANSRCKNNVQGCDWWEALTRADLTINSPHNTYKFPGLPPSPIANPGLSSLKAAFNPIASDFWYYLHDGEGQIHYARTLEEQNANIQKYLR